MHAKAMHLNWLTGESIIFGQKNPKVDVGLKINLKLPENFDESHETQRNHRGSRAFPSRLVAGRRTTRQEQRHVKLFGGSSAENEVQ